MINVLFLLLAYLLGSIPFSYLFGEIFRHQDIRQFGSGNIGATNAFRVFGKVIGIPVMILDTLKSGTLVFLMLHTGWFDGMDLWNPLWFGLASVVGHCYPIWFKFKGGKGVATSFGLLLAYDWRIAMAIVVIFLIMEIATRYVSVSSVTSSIAMLLLVIVRYFTFDQDLNLILVTLGAVIIIIIRHQSNFKRLLAGKENRIKWLDFLDKKPSAQ
ncbi:MAG: glycerol-3-phosphate 1-O-acyltransferase PlsY [Candidatus Izemoplasmatales bacterium]